MSVHADSDAAGAADASRGASAPLPVTPAFAQALLDAQPTLMWAIDRQYRLLGQNLAFQAGMASLLHRPPLLGESVLRPEWPPRVLQAWREHYDAAFAGRTGEYTGWMPTPDGGVLAELRTVPLRGPDGTVIGCAASCRDLTDQVSADALDSARAAFELPLFERHPLPMWVFDDESLRFLAVNEAAQRAYGWSEEDFLARTILDIRPRQDVASLLDLLSRGEPPRGPHHGLWVHHTHDGVPRPVEIWSSAIVWNGRPARLVTTRGLPGVAHEDELSAITLAAGVPVGMVSVRADAAVAWCNRAARALLGDGAEIDALDAVRERIHPDDRPAWLSGGAADAAPVGDVAHVRIVQRDGTVVPVGLHLLPLGAAAAGDPRPFVLTLIDRREVERARALAQEGTARTAQHQRLESLGTLAAGLAHEVRNVLGVIMGSAELLALPGTTAAESGELAGAIREAAQHGADLVASALVFAQPGPRGAPEWTPVAHHLDAAIALVDAGHRDAPLRRFLDPRAVDTPLDAAAVTQLVLNTVHNARRALGGRADGWVSISTRPLDFAHAVTTRTGPIDAGRYLGVWVRDNGAGIAPAHLSRLFEPFFTTERERGGTGLGLSGISGLLRRVGGGADVHSEPGVGTTFAFYLPARLHDPQTTTPPAERPPHVLVVSHRLRRKRDIEAALQAAGLTVEAHASPRVAIARLAAAHDPIDAVWVEYELGEWTGADFAREAVLQGVSLPPMVLAAPPGLALDPSRIAPGALVHLVPSTLEGAALPAAVTAALAG